LTPATLENGTTMTTSPGEWEAKRDRGAEAERKKEYLINVLRYCEENVKLTEDPACTDANMSVIAFIRKELAPPNCTMPGKCPTKRGYVCGGCARGY
jgi:hypothetical protein